MVARAGYASALAELRQASASVLGMMEDGSFYELPFVERYRSVRRVKKLYNRLRGTISGPSGVR